MLSTRFMKNALNAGIKQNTIYEQEAIEYSDDELIIDMMELSRASSSSELELMVLKENMTRDSKLNSIAEKYGEESYKLNHYIMESSGGIISRIFEFIKKILKKIKDVIVGMFNKIFGKKKSSSNGGISSNSLDSLIENVDIFHNVAKKSTETSENAIKDNTDKLKELKKIDVKDPEFKKYIDSEIEKHKYTKDNKNEIYRTLEADIKQIDILSENNFTPSIKMSEMGSVFETPKLINQITELLNYENYVLLGKDKKDILESVISELENISNILINDKPDKSLDKNNIDAIVNKINSLSMTYTEKSALETIKDFMLRSSLNKQDSVLTEKIWGDLNTASSGINNIQTRIKKYITDDFMDESNYMNLTIRFFLSQVSKIKHIIETQYVTDRKYTNSLNHGIKKLDEQSKKLEMLSKIIDINKLKSSYVAKNASLNLGSEKLTEISKEIEEAMQSISKISIKLAEISSMAMKVAQTINKEVIDFLNSDVYPTYYSYLVAMNAANTYINDFKNK